ncbi:MAG: PEP-CTERM sorting domain-containing protein [Rhizobacter sp.]
MTVRNAIASALLGLGLVGAAVAVPVVTVGGTVVPGQGQTSSQAGVTVLDFNTDVLPSGVTFSASASNLVTGSLANVYAAPPGDTSRYLTVSPTSGSPVTITLSTAANYIGFYAGSLDDYNLIQFFSGGNLVSSYTGTQLANFAGVPAVGDQSIGRYFNVFESGNTFTTVVLTSSQNAFELDNFAIGVASTSTEIPLPGTLSLFGLGLIAASVCRKSKK